MDAPSKYLLALEVIRAIIEYGFGLATMGHLQQICHRGDGHPVIVFPGLGTADNSTRFIRKFLEELGYTVYPWGQGRNLGPRKGIEELLSRLSILVEKISDQHNGDRVSLIGWSLGGIYSREVAKLVPDNVRQVITLGTPFKNLTTSTNAGKLYEVLSGDKTRADPALQERLGIKPTVPFTSIYSKTDGVVSWKSSLEDETDISENVEIPGASHLGLGHNPFVMYIIADRLSQPYNLWKPYHK